MALGIAKFDISNFHNDPTSPRLWWGEVRLNFDETVDEHEVTHWVTIRVRVTTDETASLQELREKLFHKAVDQLRHASQAVEGKTAQALLDAAHTQILEDRENNSYL